MQLAVVLLWAGMQKMHDTPGSYRQAQPVVRLSA